ncbi:CDP-glycerol glycerophosphotransferase family protein [Peribacillus glennii]|uniref:CDP-glycerol glycerophosphotransferase family protein n=1 Tax=Peribacillus glennii TaxID=2303991 RepID=A0A372LDB1_9BACI|nr:CDP-glycerol glycerophosphotransferase family protein [Peribacillus glennii]RFU63964.1 CDP-glycerol glycerophosphotransferase family protein [Peribacillus glennii]
MGKDFIISLYLIAFKMIFGVFKLFPTKNKITFVVSFGDNIRSVYEEMVRQHIKAEVVFLSNGKTAKQFEDYPDTTILSFETAVISDNLKAIYHLATSRYIVVDNYFGFLASAQFKKGVECIQLWHAGGAIKKFGLEDASAANRSPAAQQRFRKVYSKFDKVAVGSEEMAEIFKKAFGLGDKNILRTGVPRTDFFYDEQLKTKSLKKVESYTESWTGKKKILYAPTYRDNELNSFELKLDLERLQKEIGQDYVILLKLHPAIKKRTDYERQFPGFVFDLSSSGFHINELLLAADCLITDYSSIPYEYSLLQRPMIFFAYDLESYAKERGLWGEYENMVPGPVVTTTGEIIELIKAGDFDIDAIVKFAREHNKYSFGHSSENLLQYMFSTSHDGKGADHKRISHETDSAASR